VRINVEMNVMMMHACREREAAVYVAQGEKLWFLGACVRWFACTRMYPGCMCLCMRDDDEVHSLEIVSRDIEGPLDDGDGHDVSFRDQLHPR